MLPPSNHLPSSEVSILMRNGQRKIRSGITLIYRLKPGNEAMRTAPRFSFVVSTKVDKRAAYRNRIKRLLRESVQHLLGETVRGLDGVVMGSKELQKLTQQQVQEELRELFTLARLFTHD